MFEHPANPFVMDFLGNVNVFHGRVQNGRAMVGNWAVEYPEYPHAEPQAATLYMRPHELDIALKQNGVPSLKANVKRINPTGSVARIGLVGDEASRNSSRFKPGSLRGIEPETGRHRVCAAEKSARVHARLCDLKCLNEFKSLSPQSGQACSGSFPDGRFNQ